MAFIELTFVCSPQVLVAHSEVMGWIREVVGEVEGWSRFYDIGQTELKMDLKTLERTTTVSTTKLKTVGICELVFCGA